LCDVGELGAALEGGLEGAAEDGATGPEDDRFAGVENRAGGFVEGDASEIGEVGGRLFECESFGFGGIVDGEGESRHPAPMVGIDRKAE
jgi:hypothetical protein